MLQIKENPTSDFSPEIPEYFVDTKPATEFLVGEIFNNQILIKPLPKESLETNSDNKSKINTAQILKKINNIRTIDEIGQLAYNWDSQGADAFAEDLVSKVREIIQNPFLKYQPDIFPTFRDSIQIEYEKKNGDYLEFEFYNNEVHILKIVNDDETEQITDSVNKIISKINEFMHES
jgi:hypothetical protein